MGSDQKTDMAADLTWGLSLLWAHLSISAFITNISLFPLIKYPRMNERVNIPNIQANQRTAQCPTSEPVVVRDKVTPPGFFFISPDMWTQLVPCVTHSKCNAVCLFPGGTSPCPWRSSSFPDGRSPQATEETRPAANGSRPPSGTVRPQSIQSDRRAANQPFRYISCDRLMLANVDSLQLISHSAFHDTAVSALLCFSRFVQRTPVAKCSIGGDHQA